MARDQGTAAHSAKAWGGQSSREAAAPSPPPLGNPSQENPQGRKVRETPQQRSPEKRLGTAGACAPVSVLHRVSTPEAAAPTPTTKSTEVTPSLL